MDFMSLISQAREEGPKYWSGTFLEYLELVKNDPSVVKTAHARMYEMLTRDGSNLLSNDSNSKVQRLFSDTNLRRYNFFENEFFGMEETINQIIKYFHAAAYKGEESRQVLYFMGPVGSGKSSLVEKLKRGLQNMPSIYAIKGCPMNSEPLLIIPERLRPKFEGALGVKIEGELNPFTRQMIEEKYGDNWENVVIHTVEFSKTNKVGIGVVPPVDANNQDTSVLIGDVDIAKMAKYSEDDPRVLSLRGAFNVGNRGMVEFIEVFKNEIEFLHTMITATQEKVIPAPGRHGMIYVDEVIISHSNEAEWKKFKSDTTNEAILDRIVVIKVPYNLRLDEEVKIYKKMLSSSNFRAHIAPHSLEMAAMFAILTRLEPSNKCDLVTKLRLYNGDEIVERGRTKKVDLDELKRDTKREGLEGISTRFIYKAIDNTLSEDPDANSINPINLRETIVNMIRKSDWSDDRKKLYLEFIQNDIYHWYLDVLEKEIMKAFVHAYAEQAETLFNNYLDNVEAYVNRTRVKDRNIREEREPDIQLMKSIEEQMGITGTAADGFRNDVMANMATALRRGESFTYTSYGPLKEAIERKLVASVKELSRIITKGNMRDKDQEKKYNDMVNALIELGYDEHSVNTILQYAAYHLWKD